MQSCGACKHFQKMKHLQGNGGVCTLKDGRTNTDSGRNCTVFKRIKFDRPVLACTRDGR